MAWQNRDVVAERVELRLNSAEEQIAIAARQIPAPDAAGEKHVTAYEELSFSREETKTARRVPRHVQHFELAPEEVALRRRGN